MLAVGTSRSTMSRKPGSNRNPLANPSNSDAKRGDRGDEEKPAAPYRPASLGQRPDAVVPVGEVIHGPEDQRRVEPGVGHREGAGVAHLGSDATSGPRHAAGLLDVGGDEIHDVDVVAVGRQPSGMDSRGASDIENPRRSSGR